MLPQAPASSTPSGSFVYSSPMTPAPLSPISMNSLPQRTSSTDSTDGIRKRVCKACDRCRMKKSKCDGSHPCSRCKADNAICVFGERKKSHDKVYPKGYVEMLEQQQSQLVAGLQELYRRSLSGKSWSGPALSETAGHPLTHDILAALDLLEKSSDGSDQMVMFEEDTDKLQSRLLAHGAGYIHRRGSFSSDSDHSHRGPTKGSPRGTPQTSKAPPVFDDNFSFNKFTPSPSPMVQSPVPQNSMPSRQRQSYPPAQQSPLHRSAPITNNDPQFYQPEWSTQLFNEPEAIMRSRYALQTPQLADLDAVSGMMGNQRWDDSDMMFDNPEMMSYPQQLANVMPGMNGMQDFNNNGFEMDMDFAKFVQVGT